MESMAKEVSLKDHYGNLWPMEVVKRRGQWYFKKGWMRFREEHSVEPGDIMVFKYKGNNSFKFKLFGETSIEKIRVRDLAFYASADEESEEPEGNSEKTDDEDYSFLFEEENEVQSSYNVGKSESRTSSRAERSRTYRRGSSPRSGPPPTHRTQRKPFFVSRSSSRNALYIPVHVFKDFQITIPENVYLADEKNMRWRTQIKKWRDGRFWCTIGWTSLCNVNHIKRDSCRCEFELKQSDLYIHVRVIHNVE